MTTSYTQTETATFTVTHAKHMAAKVASDLKRMQRFYGSPSDDKISLFEAEITELIRCGYLSEVTYGFQRDGNWIEPALRYTARDLMGMSSSDDDPGRISPRADITGATFYSFLTYNSAWFDLSEADRTAVQNRIPLKRSTAAEPGINGYLSNDRIYSAGGRSLNRSSVRSF
jgi:hypothetical protein